MVPRPSRLVIVSNETLAVHCSLYIAKSQQFLSMFIQHLPEYPAACCGDEWLNIAFLRGAIPRQEGAGFILTRQYLAGSGSRWRPRYRRRTEIGDWYRQKNNAWLPPIHPELFLLRLLSVLWLRPKTRLLYPRGPRFFQ